MSRSILITGASSGLGEGMAREFAARGDNLALCARRTERLEVLKAELEKQYPGIRIQVMALDVNDHALTIQGVGIVGDDGPGVAIVVIGEMGGTASTTLDHHLVAGFQQGGNPGWDNGHTVFTVLSFSGNPYHHAYRLRSV